MEGYRDVLTQHQYMKLLCANVINRFGDSVDSIAFTWLIYAITGSASWSAVMFGLNQLPTMLLQPLAGAWVEKADKKKIMAVTDVIRGLLVSFFATAYFLDFLSPWLMAAVTLAISSAEAFRLPAGSGIIPQIIDLKYYTFASSLDQTVSRIVEIIGSGLSAVILATVGIPLALAIDILSYFGSAIIISLIRPLPAKTAASSANPPTAGAFHSYLQMLRDGLIYIRKHPIIFNFCFLGVAANGMLVPLNALMTPIVTEVWGLGAPVLSVFGTTFTVGMCIGGFLFPYLSRNKNARTIIVSGGMILAGAYALLSGGSFLSTSPAVSGIVLACIALGLGFGVALISSAFGVSLVKCIAPDYLSRVSSLVNAASTAAMPALSFLVGLCAAALPVHWILLAGAILFALVFLIVAIRKMKFE